MEYFLAFLAGMITAMLILRWAVRRVIDRVVDRLLPEVVQETDQDDGIRLKLEFDQNTYFTYNTENNQFVCQATTVQQLRERLSEMFPGQTATIVEGDPVILAALQQELERTK
jgi:hypothetical protein